MTTAHGSTVGNASLSDSPSARWRRWRVLAWPLLSPMKDLAMNGLVQRVGATVVAMAIGCSSSTPPGESPPSAKSTATAQQTAAAVDAGTATAQTTSIAPTATATAADSATPSTAAGLCKLGKNWDACADQQVELIGEKAKMVSEHPMATMPGSKQVQDYIDTEGRQVVVLTEKAIACKGKLTATGTLRSVKLGGAPGTRGSYEGYRLDNAVIVCR